MAKTRQRQIPSTEWIASLIGGAIVLGTIGFLAYETFQTGSQEAALAVTVLEVRQAAGTFVVEVEVRNDGRSAAADVHLAGSGGSDQREASAAARIDYVPGFSHRRASLVFASDPGGQPSVRIIGYSEP